MRKTKKYVALALAFVMSFAMLAGCGQPTAADKFETLAKERSELKECSTNTTMSIDLSGEASDMLGAQMSVKLNIAGWSSSEKKQAAGTISAKIETDGQAVELDLTDYVIDQSKIYFNIDTVLKAVGSFMGQEAPEGAFGSAYVMMDVNEMSELPVEGDKSVDLWSGEKAIEQVMPEAFKAVVEKITKYVGDKKLYDDTTPDTISFALTSQNVSELIKLVLEDVSANTGKYMDFASSYIEKNADFAAQYGLDKATFDAEKESMQAELKTAIDEILADFDAKVAELPKMSLTNAIAKKDGVYTQDISIGVEGFGIFSASQSNGPMTEDISAFAVPENATSFADLRNSLAGAY